MTRNQIIEELFAGRNFRDCIQKVAPAHLQDELKSEVILKVCEWPDERVTGLYDRGQLEFYVARVIINETRNKYSGFYKKFRMAHVAYAETEDFQKESHSDGGMDDGPRRRAFISGDGIPVTHIDDIQQREIRELEEDTALEFIDTLYWYDQELIRLYIRLGNYRAIEDATGIPWESAYKSIQKSLKLIRCQLPK